MVSTDVRLDTAVDSGEAHELVVTGVQEFENIEHLSDRQIEQLDRRNGIELDELVF